MGVHRSLPPVPAPRAAEDCCRALAPHRYLSHAATLEAFLPSDSDIGPPVCFLADASEYHLSMGGGRGCDPRIDTKAFLKADPPSFCAAF